MPPKIESELLHVVDTEDVLTKDDVAELKRLAQASRVVRYLVGFAIGIVMLFGFDHIVTWISRIWAR